MSSWSSWSSCTPTNGKCGAGTQYQTRTIVTTPYCSSACPGKTQTRSCTHSCCPVDCVTSSWTAWSACSNTCGSGKCKRTKLSIVLWKSSRNLISRRKRSRHSRHRSRLTNAVTQSWILYCQIRFNQIPLNFGDHWKLDLVLRSSRNNTLRFLSHSN